MALVIENLPTRKTRISSSSTINTMASEEQEARTLVLMMVLTTKFLEYFDFRVWRDSHHVNVIIWCTCNWSCSLINHFGLVMPYGDTDQGQHWLKYWLVALWYQATTWDNVDSPSRGPLPINQGQFMGNYAKCQFLIWVWKLHISNWSHISLTPMSIEWPASYWTLYDNFIIHNMCSENTLFIITTYPLGATELKLYIIQ